MSLTLRSQKGSPLTFSEMDGNLTYLEELAQQGGGGGGSSYYDNGNSSQNTVIDWSRANLQELGIDNDPTLSFTGATAGQKLTLLLSREVGESRTITWSDGVFWRDGEEFSLKTVDGGVSLDESFDIGDGFNDQVYSIALQADGGILAGGGFTEFDGNPANRLVRLNADGTLGTGFGIGDGFDGEVFSIAVQPDGGILVGGEFTEFDGNSANGLVRLNADGSLDEGFDIGGGFDGPKGIGIPLSIAVQPDGGILVGGEFTAFDGNSANSLVRLNANGSLDTGFGIGSGVVEDTVFSIAVQTDGGILVGGAFTEFDGNPANRLVRLNADGSLDSGFDIGAGFDNSVFSLVIQPDGKILVGGEFTEFDGNTTNRLVRLNADGTLDTGFEIGAGFNDEVRSITLQSDGKILVGGRFTSFDDNSANRLIRLNANGSLDTGFGIGSFDDEVQAIALQPDGKILVGGFFTEFDGNTTNNLARLIALSGDIYTPVNIYYTGTRYIGDYSSDS
jgi:uncharacterized delta-60 repeat protein